MRWQRIVGLAFLLMCSPLVEAKVLTERLAVQCDDALLCSQELTARLEAKYGVRLHADVPTDTVHGSVSIAHGTPHEVTVELYDTEQAPTTFRKSHLKPPPVPINDTELRTELKATLPGLERLDALKAARVAEQQTLRANRMAAKTALKLGQPLTDVQVEALVAR